MGRGAFRTAAAAAAMMIATACTTNGTGEPSGIVYSPRDASDDVADASSCDPGGRPTEGCPCEAGATYTCPTCCSVQITLATCSGDEGWSLTDENTLCGCADESQCFADAAADAPIDAPFDVAADE